MLDEHRIAGAKEQLERHNPPTIGDVEWTTAVGWQRRSPDQPDLPGPQALADALTTLRTGVLVLDGADEVVLANPAATELGLVRPDISDTHVQAAIRTLAGQVRQSGVRREVELDLSRPAAPPRRRGGLVGVRVHAVPLTGAGYGPGHVVIEAVDVTEAHRVARVRRDFVANVSHELKTPVGALGLLAEALLEAGDDSEAARRFADRISHESRRLARLIKELLELSRLQGAEPLPVPVPVALDRIVNEVIDRTRTEAAAKHIEVTVAGDRGLVVYGDEGQLVTAVANLVENAIAYSPEETAVAVRLRAGSEVVEVAVADHGIGIASKDLDRIFERFYRADQARSRVTGGTGLGLAIVKHITVNHGGEVVVDSTVGVGSTFTLRLPARRPEAAGGKPQPDEIGPVPADGVHRLGKDHR